MAKMLGGEMDQVERAQLVNMTLHPGYKTLRLMMDQACREYSEDVTKLNPIGNPNYKNDLVNLQLMARAVNDFCASLVKSVEAHMRVAGVERADAEQIKQTLEHVDRLRNEQ